MKLPSLLLLAVAALAAAAPTPAEDTAIQSEAATPPADALVFDFSVDPNLPALGNLGDPQPGFWDYNLTIMESYVGGELQATGAFACRGGSATFSFDKKQQNYMWAKVTDKYLQIFYDYNKHRATFAYDGWHWGQDIYAANLPGYCEDLGGWDKQPLQYPQDESATRTIYVICFIEMGMPSGGGQAELSHVDARRSVQDTASTSAVAAMPTKDLDPMSPAAADESGTQYFGFLMGVTEYCESSEGTPLMAKGYWRLAGANDGLMITFSDGNTATLLSLNTGKQLQVGPYDFYTSRVGFAYGDCHWDQDNWGAGACGWCNPGTWSGGELNCAMNAAASRNHGLQCFFAVENTASAHTQPKAIAARVTNPQPQPQSPPAPSLAPADTSAAQKTTLFYTMHLSEQCVNGKPLVTGRLSNGQSIWDLSFPPGLISQTYLLPGYPVVEVGPFDYAGDRLRFVYKSGDIDCEWYEYESWRQCAECRAGGWVGADVDCANGGGVRTKDVECSLVMRN